MRKLFTLAIALFAVANQTFASVEIDGISYNLDPSTKEASVTSSADSYFGTKEIPTQVVDENGETYTVTSIEDNAFMAQSSLQGIIIPGTVKTIGNSAFYACNSLKRVDIPEGVVTIGNKAFYGCKELDHVTIANSVTSIGQRAFSLCGIMDVKLSSGLTTIDEYTFDNCEHLSEVEIPEGVTTIAKHAFGYCTHLVKLTLPSTLTKIEYGAFGGYEECLTDVYCYAEKAPEVESDAFSPSIDKTVLHVLASALDAYGNGDPWVFFKEVVAMTEEEAGIEATVMGADDSAAIYDLNGRQLMAPQHGINIIGGKKVVMK